MDRGGNGQQYVRQEPDWQRLDRNFTELLQELRVAQTGVQILFAFLLAIAFQQRFRTLAVYQRDLYLATLLSAACAAVLLIAPVAVHRLLFRRNLKDAIVATASRLAAAGLLFLGVAIVLSVLFVVDYVAGTAAGIAIAAAVAVLVVALWVLVPLRVRARHTEERPSFDPGNAPGRSRT